MMLWWVAPLVFVASLILTAALRIYALRRSLIDVPNARSSHSVPTPRGGGVAIVAAATVALSALCFAGLAGVSFTLAVLGAGLSVAALGFADDHGHIAARWRLLGHFFASGWALFWLGGLPALAAFDTTLELGWIGHVLALLFLVWMLNLYNFMDGIDGIASIEAICTCLGALLCYAVVVPQSGSDALGQVEWVLIAAAAGFACWNFPRARIFMGDAGSGFLGVVIAICVLSASREVPHLFWCWLVLLGVFIVDATFTLLRRLLRGDAVYQAHRSHAYQSAARVTGSHVPVTVTVALINVCWLLPWALGVAAGYVAGPLALCIAYLPLVVLCVLLRAGQSG